MQPHFVAGATGYVGQQVVATLAENGLQPIAHIRPDSSALQRLREQFTNLGAETDCTAWDARALSKTFATRKPEAVYCLVGTTRRRGKAARLHGAVESYETVDFGLTKMLVDALNMAHHACRFIYLSSLGADPSARSPYMAARGKAERAVRESGLPYTIVRPSFISGKDRRESRPGERLAAIISDSALAGLAKAGFRSPQRKYGSMDAVTLARHLVRVAGDATMQDRILAPEDLRSQQ